MTEEEQKQAAAYIKLQEDVRQMVVNIIKDDISTYMFGELSQKLRWLIADQVNQEMKQYRIVRMGQTANQY